MSEEWRGLTDEQKKPYQAESEVNKKRYEAEMKAYKAKLAEMPKPKPEPTKKASAKDTAAASKEKS